MGEERIIAFSIADVVILHLAHLLVKEWNSL